MIKKVKLLNTSKVVSVEANLANFPDSFIQISKELLLGIVYGNEIEKSSIGIVYLFQYRKIDNQKAYRYVATLDFRPLETKYTDVDISLKLMQMSFLGVVFLKGFETHIALLEFEDTGIGGGSLPPLPNLVKKVFGT